MSKLPDLPPIRRILAATDLSPASLAAARTAAHLAQALDARLHLVHAAPPAAEVRLGILGQEFKGKFRQELLRELDALVAELPAQVAGAEIREGYPVDVVLEEIHRTGADLLVLGTHGRTGVVHLALGSVAEHLAQVAPIDVLLARGASPDLFRRPLLALKPTASACRAAARAAALAGPLGWNELHLASAYQLPAGFAYSLQAEDVVTDRLRQMLEEDLAPVLDQLRQQGPDLHPHFQLGSPVGVVLECAASCRADLVILGSHSRSRWTAMLLGDTARALSHRLECAIWLVRDLPERHPLLEAIARDLGLK